jgi:hypothetical protein
MATDLPQVEVALEEPKEKQKYPRRYSTTHGNDHQLISLTLLNPDFDGDGKIDKHESQLFKEMESVRKNHSSVLAVQCARN